MIQFAKATRPVVEEWYALTTSRSPRTRSGNRSGHLLPTAVVKKQHQTWCMASETHPGHRRWGSEYIPHLLFLGWREGVKGDRKGEGRRGREGEEPKESKENTGSYWGKWSSLLASAKEQRAKDKRTTETKTKDENKDKEQGGQEGRRKASKYDSNHRHTEKQRFTGLHAGVFKQARGRWQSTTNRLCYKRPHFNSAHKNSPHGWQEKVRAEGAKCKSHSQTGHMSVGLALAADPALHPTSLGFEETKCPRIASLKERTSFQKFLGQRI